jgi:hypothetical protein
VKLAVEGAVVAAVISVVITLLVPALFALGVIGFAPGRRPKVLRWLAVPLVLGFILLIVEGCIGLVGAWLLMPAVQVCFLYVVAETFVWLSGRELSNVLEDFLNARRSLESLVCTIALMLITLIPSWFFYHLFVVEEMCRA